ncbi:MAG: radical SAM family heme chaperone HemW [Spirochaetia bacterium]|nr:radical SAM family heme chaperone HemW [Spirochaetia bacterium]
MKLKLDTSNDLSLYIHIPFCITKCDYCAFYSVSHQKRETIEQFFSLLIDELKIMVSQRSVPFKTVYIGGGNPGLLGPDHLLTLVTLISSLGKVDEFSIEMNPESLDEKMYPLFQQGINRLSIGIQTLNEMHLDTLQRSASKEATFRALELSNYIHATFGTSINVDIMTCIPGQTIEESILDIDTILSITPVHHISLYNLTYEEGTLLTKRKDRATITPIPEEKEREFLITLWQHLEKRGFHQYEISNFATQEEYQCKHNIRYWNLEDYIGVGPSSVGSFHQDNGNSFIRRTGVPSIEKYLDCNERYEIEEIEKRDEIVEYMMVKLRVVKGIDKEIFFHRFNLSFDAFFSKELEFMKKNNSEEFIETQSTFSLTISGLLLCDSIISLFCNALLDRFTPLDCKK